MGIVSNYITAETTLLKNAWRQFTLFAVIVLASPFIYMYQKAVSKYEHYRNEIKQLEEEQDKLEFEIESKFDG